MPVYILHGFRWPREGFTGIRVHAIVNNLEDCSVEYIQNDNSKLDILGSFRKQFPELMQKLETSGTELDFIEQYNPDDLTGPSAVSQSHAFVADKVVELAGQDKAAALLSLNVEDVIAAGPGPASQAQEAFATLRDEIAGGEKIGWWVVYNGDPERAYDSEDDDASTPTQTTTEDATPQISANPELQAAGQPGPTSSKSARSAFSLPTRSKGGPKTVTASKDAASACPTSHADVPEPPKLKEVASKTGFRRKFFGKKA